MADTEHNDSYEKNII